MFELSVEQFRIFLHDVRIGAACQERITHLSQGIDTGLLLKAQLVFVSLQLEIICNGAYLEANQVLKVLDFLEPHLVLLLADVVLVDEEVGLGGATLLQHAMTRHKCEVAYRETLFRILMVQTHLLLTGSPRLLQIQPVLLLSSMHRQRHMLHDETGRVSFSYCCDRLLVKKSRLQRANLVFLDWLICEHSGSRNLAVSQCRQLAVSL